MKLASHLKQPLQEIKQKTTSSEFIMWMEYLKQEQNSFHREDYYMAQIASVIVKVFGEKGARIKIQDFLIKFRFDKSKKHMVVKQKKRDILSKRFWLGAFGIKDE